jgi:hypothetical protein
VFRCYAAATRNAASNFHGGRNRGYAKLPIKYEDQLTVLRGVVFS